MKVVSQLLSFPNQITLLRLIFIPFIVINIVGQNYKWALGLFVLAGVSDFFDGSLARLLKQRTVLGQYLDPIADKLLLSTMFLVLSLVGKIPWMYTVLVFSRDLFIVVIAAVIYATTSLREFRPSVFGKANTTAQVGAVFFVLLQQLNSALWIVATKRALLITTFALTLLSGIHYAITVGQRLRAPHS